MSDADSGQPASAAAPLTGFVGYDRIRVEVQEDFVADDEPFVAVLRIRSTTGVPNSTRWEWVTASPSETADVDEGETVDIPNDSGDAWFTDSLAVRTLDETQMIGIDTILTADVMVSVAFVFEGDSGSPADDVRILKSFTDPIVKSIAGIVEGAKIPFSVNALKDRGQTTAAVKGLLATVKKVQVPNIDPSLIIGLINRFVEASGDPNDIVGIASTAFIPVSQDFISLLQRLGVGPESAELLRAGEGDGNQAWTQYETWYEDFELPYLGKLGKGYLSGEVWYGLITPSWVDDWMVVESRLPWQKRVRYWLNVTAAMR
jgi:hypothetical protein